MIEGTVDILDKWLYSRLSDVNTMVPGTIVQYYGHTERKAKVKPMIRKQTVNDYKIDLPLIDNVPVRFMGSSDVNMLFPLKKGDGVMLLFSQSPFGNWKNSDNRNQQDPGDNLRFQLSDCIAVPGLFPFKGVPAKPEKEDSLYVTYKGKGIEVESGGNVLVNGGTKGGARKDDPTLSNSTTDSSYWPWLTGFVNVFLTWIPVPNDGGAALKTAMTSYIATNPVPAELKAKISGASETVLIGG
jgi:hypothetical protein